MDLSDNIKKLRNYHGLTQSELGKIAGVSDKAVSTWENGTAEPRMGALRRMCDHFGISVSMLLEGFIEAGRNNGARSLLETYTSLNQDGQAHLDAYAEMLSNNSRFTDK